VFSDLAVTWAARTEESRGRTSPEELLAAAHAACYAMALSHELAQKGQFADSLQIQAQCAFAERLGGGFAVSTMELAVVGTAPGLDRASFQEAARQAERDCPISNAIRGNVEIRLRAELAG